MSNYLENIKFSLIDKVVETMKEQGIKVPLICSHGISNKRFIKAAGDASENVVFPAGRL